MKTNSHKNSQDGNKPVKALSKVLGQTKEVKGLVDEAAQELSSANAVLKQEFEVLQIWGQTRYSAVAVAATKLGVTNGVRL